jgi:hypothetical protein
MTPMVKPAWLSKTLIVNGVSVVLFGGAAVLDASGALHLSALVIAWLGIGLGAGNFALRLATNTAIAGTPAAKAVLTPVLAITSAPTSAPPPAAA